MYHPTTRLLTVLELLQSRGQVSGQELAQILEVEERSVRRYILMLRELGIPVEGERGRHGGYSLRPGFRLPPLMFNADEITAVMIGLMLTRELGMGSNFAVESAAAKIGRVLPHELRERSEALREALNLEDVQIATYTVQREDILAVSLAAYEGKCLDIVYSSGEETQRRIAPYGVVLHGLAWYVPAYCFLRQDMRVFRLDRMRAISRTEESFSKPADFDARQYVHDSLARLPGLYTFEILVDAPLKTVEASIPPGKAILESRGNQTLLRCYTDDPRWVAHGLLQMELPFTVLHSEELKAVLRTLAGELLASI
jgi:predicted DNA-binding transcriptional regulator YafY